MNVEDLVALLVRAEASLTTWACECHWDSCVENRAVRDDVRVALGRRS